METDIIKKKNGRKLTFITIVTFISVFMLYYCVMSMIAPGLKMTEIKNELASKAADKDSPPESVFSDSTYLKLLKEKAFLQCRTVMAQTDSICLTVNLKDSTSNIEISGVTVHKARISTYEISRIIEKGDDNLIFTLLSTPLTIANSYATIKKEPVMIKMAPKDTSEFKPDIIPDTSLVEPVIFLFEMTNGIRIYFYQDDNESHEDRMSLLRFELRDRIWNTWSSLKKVVLFKVPEYHPYIKIRMPRTDSKIIYRALPNNGQIAVYTST